MVRSGWGACFACDLVDPGLDLRDCWGPRRVDGIAGGGDPQRRSGGSV